jgi:hypothetical protein
MPYSKRGSASANSIEEFGTRLIETGDLDPVYVGLAGARIQENQLGRLLLAYWFFYSLGASCWLSEQEDFWGGMEKAAANRLPPLGFMRWPRGVERRHFRGVKAVSAIRLLAANNPENLIEGLKGRDAKGVISQIETWPQCGPWIAFKAADMLERVLEWPLVFDADILMYREPQLGLELVARERLQDLQTTHLKLIDFWSKVPAPPQGNRLCGFQELETICCKFKAYRSGHYWIGKDIREVRAALRGWGTTATRVLESMPREYGTNGHATGVLF